MYQVMVEKRPSVLRARDKPRIPDPKQTSDEGQGHCVPCCSPVEPQSLAVPGPWCPVFIPCFPLVVRIPLSPVATPLLKSQHSLSLDLTIRDILGNSLQDWGARDADFSVQRRQAISSEAHSREEAHEICSPRVQSIRRLL